MAEEPNRSGSNISNYLLPAILAALALVGGYSWSLTSLSSLRPTVGMTRSSDIERPQTIEARLWQDPVAAVERVRQDASVKSPGEDGKNNVQLLNFAGMQKVLADDAQNSPLDSGCIAGMHVILAMVPGGTYAEDAEFRLRSREAVVSALSTAHYRAEDEERIGAWEVSWPREISRTPDDDAPHPPSFIPNQPAGAPTAIFPFERFRIRRNIDRHHKSQDRALVVWLPDTFFDGAPLERLTQLVSAIKALHSNSGGMLTIDVLGPLGSSMLRDMLPWRPPCNQQKTDQPQAGNKPLQGVNMFSWSATAMDGLLVQGWQSGQGPRVAVKNYLETRWGMTFTNTIATDDELSTDLVDELKLRGVDLADTTNHVVLLYEWDTYYARTLPESFAAEVRRRQTIPHADRAIDLTKAIGEILQHLGPKNYVSSMVPNVHAYTYLRGIDGKMPVVQTEKSSTGTERSRQDATAKDQNKETRVEENRTEGANQLDYMPRIALELDKMRQDLARGMGKQDFGTGRLKAIGVIGSDFYDKLLILQALREHFPGVIFFTTDLDGRFMDPDVKKWTRNLVVASAFGLTLHQDWQGSAAPFRSSYQSALYLAALQGLEFVENGRWQPAPAPRRFEIGRVHAVDLSVTTDPHGIQPTAERRIDWWRLLCGILLISVIFWLLITFVPKMRNMFQSYERQYVRQVPLFFTEKDILDPEQAASAILPWPSTPPCLIANVSDKFANRLARNEARATVAKWLDDHLQTKQNNPSPLLPKRLNPLIGPPVLRMSARVARVRQEAERIATRRLTLEEHLPEAVGSCLERCRTLNDQLKSAPVGIVLIGISYLVFLALLLLSHSSLSGEPFSLFEGVSVWPCESFRMLAIILSVAFVFRFSTKLRMSEVKIIEDYFLKRECRPSSWKEGIVWFRECRGRHPVLAYVYGWPTYLWSLPTKYPAIAWSSLPGPVDAQSLWNDYRDRGRLLPRLTRSGGHLLIYLTFCFLVVILSRMETFSPTRGGVAQWVDLLLLWSAVLSFLYLNFLVADAVRLARTFIRHLTRGETHWPESTKRAESEKIGAKNPDGIIEWLDIQFIGQLTKNIANLVYYPAIVLFLLIVARTHFFDDWQWPGALVIIFVFNASWPLISAFLLQDAATEAREDALEKLGTKIATAKVDGKDVEHVKPLEELQKRVLDYREGAFTNYLDNPALKALLVPFTGAGIINIVNLLTST